jgi:protein-tyrosine kinase
VGTIAKALQKQKAELAGQAKARPGAEAEATSAQAQSVQPPANPKKGPGEFYSSPALPAKTERSADDAKRLKPAVAVSKPSDSEALKPPARSIEPKSTVLRPIPAPAPAEARHEPPSSSAAARKGIDPSLVSLVDPDGFEADLFRLLRTRILFPQAGRPPRTILVTSALPEEGKSFVSANLAINMARHVDQHVLLVDCDLRKPSIHTRFGFNGVKGLREYLAEGVDLPALLLKSGVEKLTILPSGDPPQNPSELITSAKMAALIQELRARYHDRYIILDSPPPVMAPETSAISKWVDGILIVVKYGATPMDLVEELMTHLDREKIIGAVINKFSVREFRRYSYSKYYGYSYKKYSKDGRRPPA